MKWNSMKPPPPEIFLFFSIEIEKQTNCFPFYRNMEHCLSSFRPIGIENSTKRKSQPNLLDVPSSPWRSKRRYLYLRLRDRDNCYEIVIDICLYSKERTRRLEWMVWDPLRQAGNDLGSKWKRGTWTVIFVTLLKSTPSATLVDGLTTKAAPRVSTADWRATLRSIGFIIEVPSSRSALIITPQARGELHEVETEDTEPRGLEGSRKACTKLPTLMAAMSIAVIFTILSFMIVFSAFCVWCLRISMLSCMIRGAPRVLPFFVGLPYI